MRDISYRLFDSLRSGKWLVTGRLLDENWQLKKTLSEGISDSSIDKMYKKAIKLGAEGGKLVGAGGGGFLLMFASPDKHAAIKKALPKLREEPFEFEAEGSRVVYVGE
jgi:D-glycero-alpha-D-manno-heptose-7-phosphate kinase